MRSLPLIALACGVAPIAAMSVFWIVMSLTPALVRQPDWTRLMLGYVLIVGIGATVGMVVEIVAISPVPWLLHRYQPSWIRARVLCGVGFGFRRSASPAGRGGEE